MKQNFIKAAKLVFVTIVILFVAVSSNAQPPSDGSEGLGLNGNGSLDNSNQVANVPFDSNMTLLFALASVVLISTMLKKNKLVFLGN